MPIVVEMEINWAGRNLEIQAKIEHECNIDGLFLKYAVNREGNRWKTSSIERLPPFARYSDQPLVMQLSWCQLMPLGSLWFCQR